MKPSDTILALNYCVENQHPAFLWGPPGIGKSDMVRQVKTMRGIELIDKRLSQSDPTELKGYPWPDQAKKVMTFFQDGELPTKGKGILFLDELSHAPPSVQAPAYQLILDRRLGKYELPPGWTVIAAGNRVSDRSFVNEMSAALSSRFIHIEVDPDVEDFVTWGQKHGIHTETTGYLRYRPQNLIVDKFTPGMRGFPTPRTWAKADKIMFDPKLPPAIKTELLEGTIGSGITAEYLGFVRSAASLPDIDVIIHTPSKAQVPTAPATQYAVVSKLETVTTSKNLPAIAEYVARLPKEFEVMYMKQLIHRCEKLMETPTVVNWLAKNHMYVA